jgi:Putative Ig domain
MANFSYIGGNDISTAEARGEYSIQAGFPVTTTISTILSPAWPAFTFCTNGVVGVAYSQYFDLYPAASPTTFTLVSGALPNGLTLSNISGDVGRLSGTPTVAGSYTFTLRATNTYGTADHAFTVFIVTVAGGGACGLWRGSGRGRGARRSTISFRQQLMLLSKNTGDDSARQGRSAYGKTAISEAFS